MTEALEPADMANKSVTKAVRLLRVMAAQPRIGATATTLAKASGISRPTAFRLLYSLERTGLVDRSTTSTPWAGSWPGWAVTPTPTPGWSQRPNRCCRN